MNKFEYKNLKPFKWFVLENFPFIESDFDALTNWQLFCKLGKEMNKIIDSQNNIGVEMENTVNAFIELENYINDYFDNLDVQNEINNKLDEMAEDGTLFNLISSSTFPYIEQQNEKISLLDNKIKSLASGSPKGVFTSIQDLEENNPETGVYIISSNGHLYGWTQNQTEDPIDLGLYQSAEDSESVNKLKLESSLLYKNSLKTISNSNLDINVNITIGKFWNTSNQEQTDTNIPNACYTDLIEVEEGQIFIITSNSYLTAIAYMIYDLNGNVISYEQNNARINKTYTVVIPSNVKYLRASSFDKDTFSIKLKNSLLDETNEKIDKLNLDILSSFSSKFPVGYEKEIDNSLFIYDIFINKSGAEVENINTTCTDFLPLEDYSVLWVTAKSQYATCIYALYDENKNCIRNEITGIYATFGYDSVYNNHLINYSDILKDYPLAKYIRLCSYPTTTNPLKVTYRPKVNLFEVINGNTLVNKTAYVFGDSIMHGHTDAYGIAELLRDNNKMNATNYAQNGRMISDDGIFNEVSNASSSIPDFVIFDGYINDVFQDITNIGSISNNYETFPDTFCGHFEKLCNAIKTKYPTSNVIYMSVHKINFHITQQKQIHDLAIEICKKWNISVVDMFNDGQMNTFFEYQKNHYTKGNDGTHPNIEGYKKYYMPLLTDKMLNS